MILSLLKKPAPQPTRDQFGLSRTEAFFLTKYILLLKRKKDYMCQLIQIIASVLQITADFCSKSSSVEPFGLLNLEYFLLLLLRDGVATEFVAK